MTKTQKTALQKLLPLYGLSTEEGFLNIENVFSKQTPLILEIGFGNGNILIAMAENSKETQFIGIEVYRPGVGTLLNEIHKKELHNIKIFCDDAKLVLTQAIPNHCLDVIQIFFPDPWPKKRHYKRRLIQKDFVALLKAKLKPNGLIHIKTDWEAYAQHILTVMEIAGFQHCASSTAASKAKNFFA